MIINAGIEQNPRGAWGKLFLFLVILLLISACSQGNKAGEELRGEIQELKKEVKVLQEKVDRLQASQQTLIELLKKPEVPEAAAPPQGFPAIQQPPEAPQALTVSQLIAKKEQYLGTRVTVKGEVGPVLVHHKSLLLKSPDGMVEVLFGKLPDQKQVQRLTSIAISQPLTVTGVVSLPPRPTGFVKLQINAEGIDF